ncbi:LemA family protein [archaeon]|jgi:LemA protein|nr:LemA family protein [Cryomorphaceae bacterium]MBT3465143.1 LemA family protein [archaeon]MBT4352423.1 LemA family protein [archaeon]MBT4648670.1 LemA family protein [archaeon]MBT6821794.1 LemA family protein [archaeon]
MKAKKSPNNGFIIGGIILGIILIVAMWFGGTYNSLVGLDETVNEKWANVQSAYQRRADLIPNLVEIVKAYSDYEGDVLTEITKARASVAGAGTPTELQQAGNELNSALSRLLVVVENYPNLKANENYLALQAQLEGTENRIKVERDIYNGEIKKYNIKVRRFPSNTIAGIFGFDKRDSFSADAGAENAPKVDFE